MNLGEEGKNEGVKGGRESVEELGGRTLATDSGRIERNR